MGNIIKNISSWFKKTHKKIILFNDATKSERLIYIVMMLWAIFGVLGIKYSTNLVHLAGYYASLAIFIGSYLWGEYKRKSDATKLLENGPNSVREITIYFTLLLWIALGVYGIIKNADISKLTVYFTALSPFVDSFIIYETSRKDKTELPIINDDKLKKLSDEVVEKGKN